MSNPVITKTFQWEADNGRVEWLAQRGQRFAELLCDISQELDINPCKEIETITVGRLGRKLVELMPEFSWEPSSGNLLTEVDGKGLLGHLTRRPVLYDHTVAANNQIIVTSSKGNVTIEIKK